MGVTKDEEAIPVHVKGKELICPICGNKHFYVSKAQLNTALFSFFDIDFLNKTANCYVCSECTHINWFLDKY